MTHEKFWGAIFTIIYWSDWFVAGVFIFFILTMWASAGVNWNTIASIGNMAVWDWGTIAFLVFIFPFIVYLVWFPWSYIKKRRMIFLSELTQPGAWIVAIALLLTYFFSNGYTFSNLSYNPEGFSNVGWAVYQYFILVWIGSFWFCIALVFLSGIIFVPYKISGFWYRKFGIEPMTWEEAMQLYGS